MATKLNKVGYAQLEPNKIAAQYTKQIFDMLPLDDAVTLCEQGMVLVYDEAEGKVKKPDTTNDVNKIFGLVYNEIVLEDERKQADTDYAMVNVPASKYQGAIKAYPRLFAFTEGDTFTTNAITTDDGIALPEPKKFYQPDADGYWSENKTITELNDLSAATAGPVLQVKKKYTTPDGQLAVKFVVVKA